MRTSQEGNRSQDAGAGLAAGGVASDTGAVEGWCVCARTVVRVRSLCLGLCVHPLTATAVLTTLSSVGLAVGAAAQAWGVASVGGTYGCCGHMGVAGARHLARGGAPLPRLFGSLLCVCACLCALVLPNRPKRRTCCAMSADCGRLEQGAAMCWLHTAHAGAAVSWWVGCFCSLDNTGALANRWRRQCRQALRSAAVQH